MPDLNGIDTLFSQAVESTAMPGIIAVAATDKGVLYEGAFGKRDPNKEAPMTLDTVVWIASMTKAITAAAAMQLVERGQLRLERPASEVIPDIAAAQVLEGFDAAGKPRLRAPKRPITLRHLLTHTAGFSYEIWNADSVSGDIRSRTLSTLFSHTAVCRPPYTCDDGVSGWGASRRRGAPVAACSSADPWASRASHPGAPTCPTR
jgi:methyl acetate hydrolase